MFDETRALERRGRRIAGFIVFMLGAGVVLDGGALWSGFAVSAAGMGLWVSSFMAKPSPDVLAESAREES